MSSKPEIVLLTDARGGFGQLLKPWESMDVARLVDLLSERYSVSVASFEQIVAGAVSPKGKMIIHSSSQQPEYKAYIDDVLLYLSGCGNTLIPSIHVTRGHENKGYQELHKRLRGLSEHGPVGHYYYSAPLNEPSLPIVFKELGGFGSAGVRLVQSRRDLEALSARAPALTISQRLRAIYSEIGFLIRKYILRRSDLRPWGDYYDPRKRFVLQAFVPGLAHDYKVLIFHRRAFVLKRRARKDDFRSSGSGLFSFEEAPSQLLDFAHEILKTLDEPYLSLDICFDGKRYYLLEFQGVHFGPLAVFDAPFHYTLSDGDWRKTEERPSLEALTAESLIAFMDDHKSG